MPLRVALLRSIVINGRRVKMADARALAQKAGGKDVRSVIATGNLVFHSAKSASTLEREMEEACEVFYGKATEIVVKTEDEWRAMLAANPFVKEAKAAPARLLLWAMREPLPEAGLEQLRRRASGEERIARTSAGDIYMWFGQGPIDASKVPAGFGLKSLGAVGTNRNWNTVMKITQVLDEMSK